MEQLLVALDVDTVDDARALANRLRDEVEDLALPIGQRVAFVFVPDQRQTHGSSPLMNAVASGVAGAAKNFSAGARSTTRPWCR